MHSNGGEGVMSASIQKPLNEVESVCKYGSPSSCRNRKFRSSSSSYLNKNVLEEPLLYSSDKSILQVTRDADTWLALGNIVWVKAVHNGWWPAEVRDLRILDSNDSQRTARVLVELFELQERVWVDTSVLSQFPKFPQPSSTADPSSSLLLQSGHLPPISSNSRPCPCHPPSSRPLRPPVHRWPPLPPPSQPPPNPLLALSPSSLIWLPETPPATPCCTNSH
ncbi:hypothetical protein KSP40_PGU003417 [Platanthera guangdongensis]|uniref:PWWP domain-containing protein n=1 Tax=Platanthera guangdongensis TaxID=2320717 RepID=A0ABR2MI78_9ASPA